MQSKNFFRSGKYSCYRIYHSTIPPKKLGLSKVQKLLIGLEEALHEAFVHVLVNLSAASHNLKIDDNWMNMAHFFHQNGSYWPLGILVIFGHFLQLPNAWEDLSNPPLACNAATMLMCNRRRLGGVFVVNNLAILEVVTPMFQRATQSSRSPYHHGHHKCQSRSIAWGINVGHQVEHFLFQSCSIPGKKLSEGAKAYPRNTRWPKIIVSMIEKITDRHDPMAVDP